MKMHENVEFVEKLFFEQIKTLSLKSKEDTFGVQFSDAWL